MESCAASSFFVGFFGKRSGALPDDGPSQKQSRPAPFGASQASSAAEHDIGWHEERMSDGWDFEQLEDLPFDPEENLTEEPAAPQQRATTSFGGRGVRDVARCSFTPGARGCWHIHGARCPITDDALAASGAVSNAVLACLRPRLSDSAPDAASWRCLQVAFGPKKD